MNERFVLDAMKGLLIIVILIVVAQSVNVEVSRDEVDEIETAHTEIERAMTCSQRQEEDQEKCGNMMGCVVTLCEEDGSYSAKQCSGSTGFCWCVDEVGVTYEGSEQREWESGKLDCEALRKAKPLLSEVKTEDTERATEECTSHAECQHHANCFKGKCVCRTACPRIYFPVCGSDGKTYSNLCVLEAVACEGKVNIVNIHDGPCERPKKTCNELECPEDQECVENDGQGQCICMLECDNDHSPVCGSDGKTYETDCKLRKARCEQRQPLYVLHEGECEDQDQPQAEVDEEEFEDSEEEVG